MDYEFIELRKEEEHCSVEDTYTTRPEGLAYQRQNVSLSLHEAFNPDSNPD